MEFDKDMQKFVLALHKLDIKELCGVAEMLNVPIWTDPLPVPRSQSEDADGINPIKQDINDTVVLSLESDSPNYDFNVINFADRQSGVGQSSTPCVPARDAGVAAYALNNADDKKFVSSSTNPFVTANRSQPRDGIDIIVDMCDAYSQLPRANKRYLLKLVKRAGGR